MSGKRITKSERRNVIKGRREAKRLRELGYVGEAQKTDQRRRSR